MPRKPDPKSKAGFVRSFPPSTPAAEIVAKAKANRMKMDVRYVYSVRTAVRATAKKAKSAPAKAAPTAGRRGSPRPPKAAATNGARPSGTGASGLEAAIEAIVERKVHELLKAQLGTLFG